MIFDRFKRATEAGALREIYIAPSAGMDMQSVNSVHAISNKGLEGDRYCDNMGHWKIN